ncbi:unnamed protein product [Effrenium voratum]|nr:unnamed protein product [Effrenium voratum]
MRVADFESLMVGLEIEDGAKISQQSCVDANSETEAQEMAEEEAKVSQQSCVEAKLEAEAIQSKLEQALIAKGAIEAALAKTNEAQSCSAVWRGAVAVTPSSEDVKARFQIFNPETPFYCAMIAAAAFVAEQSLFCTDC